MVKARFQSLKELRFVYEHEQKMEVIIAHIECAVILNNILIEDAIPEDWYEKPYHLLEEEAISKMCSELERLNGDRNSDDDFDDNETDLFKLGHLRRDRIADLMMNRALQ
jgi:hypothetical protein